MISFVSSRVSFVINNALSGAKGDINVPLFFYTTQFNLNIKPCYTRYFIEIKPRGLILRKK